MKNANNAVIKGIKLIVNTTFATVVDIIDRIKQIFDKPNIRPASTPKAPHFFICVKILAPYL